MNSFSVICHNDDGAQLLVQVRQLRAITVSVTFFVWVDANWCSRWFYNWTYPEVLAGAMSDDTAIAIFGTFWSSRHANSLPCHG